MPVSKETDAWLVFAVQELIKQVKLQYYEEGSNFEGSTSYHRLSTEFVLFATALVYGVLGTERRNVFSYYDKTLVNRLEEVKKQKYDINSELFFPKWYLERLCNAGKFTKSVLKSNNEIVQIGDNDSGRLIKLTPTGNSTKENVLENLEMYQIIVDKDEILPKPLEDAVKQYYVKKPQEIEFQCTCSDFWWCTNNVAKGLWRKEIPYTMDVLNYVLRPQLLRMLNWKIGYEYDFSISTGKSGKYIEKYLPKEDYSKFLKTYPVGDVEAIWDAVFEMCDLFQSTAEELSGNMGFSYDYVKAKNCRDFLEHIRQLPMDAESVFL
mgnify:CR=1 FL=1